MPVVKSKEPRANTSCQDPWVNDKVGQDSSSFPKKRVSWNRGLKSMTMLSWLCNVVMGKKAIVFCKENQLEYSYNTTSPLKLRQHNYTLMFWKQIKSCAHFWTNKYFGLPYTILNPSFLTYTHDQHQEIRLMHYSKICETKKIRPRENIHRRKNLVVHLFHTFVNISVIKPSSGH